MGRPTNREQLLDAACTEFSRLIDVVVDVPSSEREVPGACEDWSVKDLLAHLDAWHELFIGWEAKGSQGGAVDMPAPGYRWADTPALNREIFERTADDSWREVTKRLERSHHRILEVIGSYDDDELFTKQQYRWTGSTSVGSYATSATSSHYAWAAKLINAWATAPHRV